MAAVLDGKAGAHHHQCRWNGHCPGCDPKGDNENNFPIEVLASETAAQQIQCEVDKAKAKQISLAIKIWVHGPCEVEFDTSKEGDQRLLKLCVAADLVRPAHPLIKG